VKAVQFSRFGPGWEVAEVVDLPDPGLPAPGEVLLDILASPINPSDLLNFEGRFGAYAPALPAAAGGEAVGRIAAVGEGVTHVRPGDRVLAIYGGRGNWRERRRVPAAAMFPLPSAADALQLAMFSVNPGTAWHMLTRFVPLAPGDWVLQNAGTSAVGHHVIKLAARMGARTISIVRRAEHAATLKALGADAVVVDGPDLPARVTTANEGAPIRLALDAVAGEATRTLVASVAKDGVVVIYGLLSGNATQIDAADPLFRNVAIRGFWFSAWFGAASAQERKALYDELTPLLLDGTLAVPVEATYPLPRVREALAHAARVGRGGKVLLTMNET
jgi:mitochondrial enoyl-[acyl-carrier protein] reductase / trans-2-enoyl-CoA reductase